MCLFANQTQLPRAAQCANRLLPHATLLPHTQLRTQAANGRRPLQLHAVIMQDAAVHSQNPGLRQRSSSMGQPDSSNSSSSSLSPPGQAASLQVEVHFEAQYGCEFGQHLSIIGTPQGWQTAAATSMKWSEGNIWKAVLSVPVGTDIEYKYLVVWDDGNVARWQDGPNNKLSVQHTGVLMQVQDTWSQQERSVREVGPRLNRNQHNKQAGGHTSPAAAAPAGGGSGAFTQAAAADQPADAGAPHISDSSPVAAAAAAAFTVLPVQPAWGRVLQSHSLLLDAYHPAAAAAAEQDEDHLQYEAVIEEEEDQQWPAKILHKAAAAGQPLARSVPSPASAAPQQAAAPASAHAPGHSHTHHTHTHGKHTQLQQQQAAPANLAELLPLLHTELQSALEELAKHPEAAQEHGGLLSEGQTVLAALGQQVAPQGTGTSSSVAAGGSRSSARSPSATLTSGDEVAAALLSDDCEEACFCMVDAICSCSDWDLNCACEEDPDTPCELADDDDEAAHTPVPAAHTPVPAAHQPGTAPAWPAPTHAAATHAAGSAAPAGDWSSTAPSTISVAELARAAAIAATHDPAALAARAAVFTDVQAALEKSAQLLLALSDPCHPLVLEADRSLATASRQLHSGHLLN